MIMVDINNDKLRRILNNINQDKQMKDQYESKWDRIVNFLHNNIGYKIGKVAKAGSGAKHTTYRKSDLDVIFCTSPIQNKKEVLDTIEDKANSNFSQVAEVKKSSNAVHINFLSPKCDIDVVYLTQKQFNKEHEAIKNVGRLPKFKLDAIKLVKYAIDNTVGKKIKSYEIELSIINSNCTSLVGCVNYSVHHFTGRVQKLGYSIDDVLNYLT